MRSINYFVIYIASRGCKYPRFNAIDVCCTRAVLGFLSFVLPLKSFIEIPFMALGNSQYNFIEKSDRALLSKRAILHVKCRFNCESSVDGLAHDIRIWNKIEMKRRNI